MLLYVLIFEGALVGRAKDIDTIWWFDGVAEMYSLLLLYMYIEWIGEAVDTKSWMNGL